MEEKTLVGYPSIDKPWLKYYSDEALSIPPVECTVYENIYRNNSAHLSDVALEYFGRKITYKKVFEQVEKTKRAFEAYGVKKGDRVIMFTSSTPELVYSVLALSRIGAVANMINPVFEPEQIKNRVNETNAEIMLVLDQLFVKIQPLLKDLCIKKTVVISVCAEMPGIKRSVAAFKMKVNVSYDNNTINWNRFIEEGKKSPEVPDVDYEKDIPLVMVYSSGTTGASKGIVLTNNGINSTISHYLNPDFPYNRGDSFLQLIPVWFSTGIVLSMLMPLCLGIRIIMGPVFSKENFARDLKKYRPQMTLAPISLWLYVIRNKEFENVDLSNLIYPFTGGELVLPRVENMVNSFLEKRNCKSVLMKGYGMCELGSTVATDSLLKHKTGPTGYPMKGVTVSAFDLETNKELKYGERGEIRVDSPAHMKEYYKNPEATNKFFYKDAKGTVWGCTGDMGYVDEDGFVFILGRITDTMVVKNGKKIYCFDVENEIYKNENVAQCEVVSVSVGGHDIPVAHIVLEEHCASSVEKIIENIHDFCLKNLNEDSVPCGYKIWDAFPVKSSGKRDMETIKQEREGFVIPTEKGIERVTF